MHAARRGMHADHFLKFLFSRTGFARKNCFNIWIFIVYRPTQFESLNFQFYSSTFEIYFLTSLKVFGKLDEKNLLHPHVYTLLIFCADFKEIRLFLTFL